MGLPLHRPKKALGLANLPGMWNYFGVAWHPRSRLSLTRQLGYSYRKATIGSTFIARRAGM
jgi:hypothetical protein